MSRSVASVATVAIVAFDGCQPLDVVGPAEVFAGDAQLRPVAYDVVIVSPIGGLVRSTSGVALATVPPAELPPRLDTLVVAGGFGARRAARDPDLVALVRALAGRARRTASVCTGAFVLAAAGLLDGKRATTHWWSAERLARDHPLVEVDPEPIFVRDGETWTSAGVTAGMDLALAMVSDDLGDEVAREIARWLVMFVQRPGGQSQFSVHLSSQRAARPSLRELQDWIAGHPDADLSVAALARRASMSPRHLARAFRDEIGVTPAAYVASARIEAAKQELASTADAVPVVARRCGFATPETFHRVFRRVTGTTPDRYRQHFAPATAH